LILVAGVKCFSTAVPLTTAVPKATGPGLDKNGEPRFLEQVKLFYASAASKTGIDP
jgi:hypothetical protein